MDVAVRNVGRSAGSGQVVVRPSVGGAGQRPVGGSGWVCQADGVCLHPGGLDVNDLLPPLQYRLRIGDVDAQSVQAASFRVAVSCSGDDVAHDDTVAFSAQVAQPTTRAVVPVVVADAPLVDEDNGPLQGRGGQPGGCR